MRRTPLAAVVLITAVVGAAVVGTATAAAATTLTAADSDRPTVNRGWETGANRGWGADEPAALTSDSD